ncbi:MAG: hypothetical protein ACRC0K_00690 [Fusobacteriaceae bacterium]
MKKYITLFFLTIFFASCTSSFKNFSDTAMDIAIPIPKDVENTILNKVNLETELYGIGTAVIGDNDLNFSYEKAILNSKEHLRNEMVKETNLIFKAYTLDMDSQRKNIFTPLASSLVNSTVNSQLIFAEEKGRWDDTRKVYILFTLDRKNLKKQSDKVFLKYIDDLILKLNSSKSQLQSSEF